MPQLFKVICSGPAQDPQNPTVAYHTSMEAALRFAAAMEKLGRVCQPVDETDEEGFKADQTRSAYAPGLGSAKP